VSHTVIALLGKLTAGPLRDEEVVAMGFAVVTYEDFGLYSTSTPAVVVPRFFLSRGRQESPPSVEHRSFREIPGFNGVLAPKLPTSKYHSA
jgi:hypothetical protein